MAAWPSTTTGAENQLRLARRTDWAEREGGSCLGSGQRILATDAEELPLLECLRVELKS